MHTANYSPIFQRLTVTVRYTGPHLRHALFPYVELIYAHWYTRTYHTESAV